MRRSRRLPSARGPARSRSMRSTYEAVGARLPPPLRRDRSDRAAGRAAVFSLIGLLAGLASAPMPSAIVAAALLGGMSWRLAGLADARAERHRMQRIAEDLPDALDLLAVCVIGGMGLDPAMRRVGAATAGPLGDAMAAAVRALDAGLRWDDALEILSDRAGCEEVRGFVSAMKRAARYGSPLADTLARQAAETRAAARDRVREHAAAAPVRMLFPLTLCFLPAFALLAIAPSLIVAIRSLSAG